MDSLCTELPFASVSDETLSFVLNTLSPFYSVSNLNNLQYDTFSPVDDKYNRNLDINGFYAQQRAVNIPQTNYISLDNMSFEKNTLTLLNLNIRSIPKNIYDFVDTVLHVFPVKIDVIGFTEIRLDPHLSSLYELPGYDLFTNCRNVYGGGVAMYVSRDHQSTLQVCLTITDPSLESLGVECTIESKLYLFLCIYRPPRGNFNNFMNIMTDLLSFTHDKKICWCFCFW